MTSGPSRQAAAITRALRELTAGRLATTPAVHPVTAGGAWQVTTTTLLARQLEDAPDGYPLVRRRVAAALDVDPARIGVCIDPDRGVIALVLCAAPQPHQQQHSQATSAATSAPADSDSMPIAADPVSGDITGVATLDALAVWWRHLDRRPSLVEARHAHRVYETRRPVGYQIGHQAHHPDPTDPAAPARYTLDALVPKATYAPIATFNTLADGLTCWPMRPYREHGAAPPATPRSKRHSPA